MELVRRGADTLRGNAGNDFLHGAGGIHTFSAGEGDDEVDSRDYWGESVDCGPGADFGEADPADTLTACESQLVDVAPPFTDPTAPSSLLRRPRRPLRRLLRLRRQRPGSAR